MEMGCFCNSSGSGLATKVPAQSSARFAITWSEPGASGRYGTVTAWPHSLRQGRATWPRPHSTVTCVPGPAPCILNYSPTMNSWFRSILPSGKCGLPVFPTSLSTAVACWHGAARPRSRTGSTPSLRTPSGPHWPRRASRRGGNGLPGECRRGSHPNRFGRLEGGGGRRIALYLQSGGSGHLGADRRRPQGTRSRHRGELGPVSAGRRSAGKCADCSMQTR